MDWEVSFSFRPARLVRNLAVAALGFAVLINPASTSKASDQVAPPPPDPAVVARAERVSLVEGELLPRMTKSDPAEVHKVSAAIVDECDKRGVDPLFVLAIIESESNFDVEAVSPTGARGLMQLIPSTFKQMSDAKRMFDPAENVRAGIRYVRHLWDAGFGKKGGPESVLLAYNQGPKMAVDIYKNGAEMPDEAAQYVPKVMAKYKALLAKHGQKPKDARKLFMIASRYPSVVV